MYRNAKIWEREKGENEMVIILFLIGIVFIVIGIIQKNILLSASGVCVLWITSLISYYDFCKMTILKKLKRNGYKTVFFQEDRDETWYYWRQRIGIKIVTLDSDSLTLLSKEVIENYKKYPIQIVVHLTRINKVTNQFTACLAANGIPFKKLQYDRKKGKWSY